MNPVGEKVNPLNMGIKLQQRTLRLITPCILRPLDDSLGTSTIVISLQLNRSSRIMFKTFGNIRSMRLPYR